MRRILTFFILLCIAVPTAAFADAQSIPYGDPNGDGAVSAADAAIVLRAAAGQIPLDARQSAASDVTGNMCIDSVDANAILLKSTDRLNNFTDLNGLLSGSLLEDRYIERFSYQGTIMTGASYRSDRVSVSQRTFSSGSGICYVMDIYIRDIRSFGTAFSSDTYRGARESVQQIAAPLNAIVAINGDMYSDRTNGPIVRSGVWYNDQVSKSDDLCVLYRDGRMVTFAKGVTLDEIRAFGDVYHSWNAGPMLLDDDGTPLKSFCCHTDLKAPSNRTAIGYYEPGHYCFVVVGSPRTGMTGVSMQELAKIMSDLGCKAAYNLRGGQTSSMVGKSGVIMEQHSMQRNVDSILYIAEPNLGGKAS